MAEAIFAEPGERAGASAPPVAVAAPTPISVHMFGPFRLVAQGRIVDGPSRGAARDLLAFLVDQPARAVRRERVVDLFWGEAPARGRAALSTTLWRLSKACEHTPLAIRSTDEMVWVEGARADRHDLADALAAARAARNTSDSLDGAVRAALEGTLSACEGDYLEGCEMDWALAEREAARDQRLDAMRYLADDALARERPHAALRWVRAALAADPYGEALHHRLMELYVRTGRRARAILHYERLRDLLASELGMAPQPETTALRNRLISRGETRVRIEPLSPR